MKLKFLLTIAAAGSVMTAGALDVTTAAGGSLASQIGDNNTITTLKVTGPVDASDFVYITENLRSLTSLDLSESTITAASGVKNATGNSEYEAGELPAYALFGSDITSIVLPADLVKIGEGALGKTRISSITIPASVTAIASHAFTGCDRLEEITVPSTVTEIGNGVWKDCTALEKANVYTRLESIGDNLFEGCVSLTEATFQPTFKSIGEGSFENCTALANFTFPASLISIGDKAFYNSGLTTVHLDNSSALASIGDFAFAKCGSLESVTMGNQTTALGKGLFFDDAALRQVQLPSSTSAIPAFTFKGTNSIDTEGSLPSNTTEIGDYALFGWDHAESLVLPEGVSHIGSGAMEGWNSLQRLGAENLSAVPSLGSDVWSGVNQEDVTLYVNSNTASQFQSADQWKEFKISIGTSGADDIIDDVTGENRHANVDFTVGDGYLKVQSHGADIARITIYDLNGRNRYAADADTTSLIVNTAQWRGSVLIVDVTLADATRATIKLSI